MRKLMWFVIGFAVACAFCAYFYVPWMVWAFSACLLPGILLAYFGRFRRGFAYAALILLGISIGFGWSWVHDSAYLSPVRNLDGKFAALTITASDYGEKTDYGTAVDGRIELGSKQYKIRAYLDGNADVTPGDSVTGRFSLRFTAFGGSKEPTSSRADGVYLLLYQRGEPAISRVEKTPTRYFPALFRRTLLDKIDTLFSADTAGFVKALLLGDRSGIDYQTNTAFKVSGISHIVAVSGLHISILFGLLYTLSLRRRWLTALIGIPAMVLFAAMVGFTPSVTRACVMQILMLLAMLADREYDPPTALAFAVLVMLAVNPMTIVSISFQLSVGCMIGIFLFSDKIRQWLESRRIGEIHSKGICGALKRWFISSVSVSISSSVITTPLVAWYFGTVSLVSVLTNLLTVWVISFIFSGTVLVLLLHFLLPGFAGVVAWVISWPVRYVLLTAQVLADFPMAAVYTESIYIVIWLGGCYVLLAAFLLSKEKYPLVFSCCAAVSLCISMLLSWYEPLMDDLRVTVLDVGQGQCILLQSEGRTYMVDCGGDSDAIAADKAAEHLLSRGIDHLDGIILTHFDADHAGGVEYLLTRIETDALYLPDTSDRLASAYADIVYDVDDDTELTFGTATLTMLAPEISDIDNESGICVLFRKGNCDILITGDRGELGEMLLLRHTELPELDLLIAGHHGAASSTGDALLSQTRPETVVISVGKNNYYGHPSELLLARLASFGCTVYRTDYHGTVVYRR